MKFVFDTVKYFYSRKFSNRPFMRLPLSRPAQTQMPFGSSKVSVLTQ